MPLFAYHCPETGLNVRVRIAHEPGDYEAQRYEMIICTACEQAHFMHPKTRHLLGIPSERLGARAGPLLLPQPQSSSASRASGGAEAVCPI